MSPNRMTDGELQAYGNEFAEFASQNAATLGLSPAQVAELQDLADDYHSKLVAQVEAQNAAMAATRTKLRAEEVMLDKIRQYSNQWRANPDLPNTLLQQGGIARRKPRRRQRPLFEPSGLSLRTTSAYSVRLQWERNCNANDTLFGVEARSEGGEWQMVGFTKKKSYVFTPESVSSPIVLRVFAMRGERRSAATDTVTAFAPLGTSSLPQIAA